MWQSLPMDCLPIFNKPHKYSQKTKAIRDAQIQTATNPMQDRNFGMLCGKEAPWETVLVANPV